jgi:hypothetical protein
MKCVAIETVRMNERERYVVCEREIGKCVWESERDRDSESERDVDQIVKVSEIEIGKARE